MSPTPTKLPFVSFQVLPVFPFPFVTKSHPLLSVVVPTLNRPSLLRETLFRLLASYPTEDGTAEFIVVDNASDIPVHEAISDIVELFSGRLSCIRFEDRCDITDSFDRAVGCASGKYVQIFGDDDFPCGLFGHRLISILSKDEPSLVYLNRFIGDSRLREVGEIAHPFDVAKEPFLLPLDQFISSYTHWPGFITSLVFVRDAWALGKARSSKSYPGYTFLDYLYRSQLVNEVLVVGDPAIIQRRGIQTWKKMWPMYWYLGMASLLRDLDSANISSGALDHWLDKEIKFKNHAVDLLIARALPDIYSASYWHHLRAIFKRKPHLLFSARLINFLPAFFCLWILSLSPNKNKYGVIASV